MTCPAFSGTVLGEKRPAKSVVGELYGRTVRLEVTSSEVVDAIALYRVITMLTVVRHRSVNLIGQAINLLAVLRRKTDAHFEDFRQLLLLVLSSQYNSAVLFRISL